MSAPLSISVVTPSLNQGAYIAEAIESVAAQDYPVLEHLVVDAGSTDGTLEVLMGFEHVEHLKWTSEPDEGQSDGLNKGFRRARGDWVLWLNADDYLMPGVIRAYVGALAKRPNLDYLYGHTEFVDKAGRSLRTVYHIPYRYAYSACYFYVPPTTGSLFRRDLLLEAPLDTDYHYLMDVEWFLRRGKTLRTARLDLTTTSFRLSGENKTYGSVTAHRPHPEHRAEWQRIFATYDRREHRNAQSRLGCRLARYAYYASKLRFAHKYLAQRRAAS